MYKCHFVSDKEKHSLQGKQYKYSDSQNTSGETHDCSSGKESMVFIFLDNL
jgi:hypothetical protein